MSTLIVHPAIGTWIIVGNASVKILNYLAQASAFVVETGSGEKVILAEAAHSCVDKTTQS